MKTVTDRNTQLLENLTAIYKAGLALSNRKLKVAKSKEVLDNYVNARYCQMYASPNKLSERAIEATIRTEDNYKERANALMDAEKKLRDAELTYECLKREHTVLINLPANYKTKGK